MPRKSYYRRPDGLYEVKRTVNGKRVTFRGRTCAEVDRKILEYNAEVKNGRRFAVVADEWYELHEKDIAYNTYRTYGFAVRRLKENFTEAVGKIKPLDIKRYISDFESKGYSMNTVQIELGVLKQILSHAVLAGDIDVNPAAEVRRSRRLPKKKRTALTEEQEVAVENYRGKDYLLGLMLLYTGARRGELLALNWQDINHLDKTITISKKLNYGYGNTPHLENRLKNSNSENNDGEKRVIPLLAPLADALPRNRIGKVFTNDDGEYLTASQLNSRWKEYCRNVGLTEWVYDDNGKATETFPVTPHCFRHSFATICFEAGVDAKTTAAYIGDTEQVARDIYTELRKRHSTTGAERVDAYLEMRRMGRADEA